MPHIQAHGAFVLALIPLGCHVISHVQYLDSMQGCNSTFQIHDLHEGQLLDDEP